MTSAYILVTPVGKPVEQEGGDETSDGINEIVGADIHCGATKKNEDWHQNPEQPSVATLPSQNHRHRAHANMTARKRCRRPLSELLGFCHQLTERTCHIQMHRIKMRLEEVAHLREDTVL